MNLRQRWPLASRPKAIVIIGAGGIVKSAHLPAYRRLGLPVRGIYDLNFSRAKSLNINAYATLKEAASQTGVVFDVAVPASQIPRILSQLPQGAGVLVQKPMGEDLKQASVIHAIAKRRKLKLAVNFQLRFAPNMLALKDLVRRGALGEITDIEVRVVIDQPWALWDFLKGLPRMEVLYHSIHYIDLIRHLIGEPRGVFALGVKHPKLPEFADSRGTIILDYGPKLRCSLLMNHTHRRGPKFQASQIMVEGLKGAAVARMGVNLNYPKGLPDTLELSLGKGGWKKIPLRGSWFTEAFEGPMSNLQRFVAGEDKALVSPSADALKTMAVVEACYRSRSHIQRI